jgi:hypothetical protein
VCQIARLGLQGRDLAAHRLSFELLPVYIELTCVLEGIFPPKVYCHRWWTVPAASLCCALCSKEEFDIFESICSIEKPSIPRQSCVAVFYAISRKSEPLELSSDDWVAAMETGVKNIPIDPGS